MTQNSYHKYISKITGQEVISYVNSFGNLIWECEKTKEKFICFKPVQAGFHHDDLLVVCKKNILFVFNTNMQKTLPTKVKELKYINTSSFLVVFEDGSSEEYNLDCERIIQEQSKISRFTTLN